MLAGGDGDLGAGAGLAGDGLDLDQAVVDLGNLDLEQAADKVGMRAGHDDGRAGLLAAHARGVRTGIANLDDEHLQALVVAIVLAGRTLVALAGIALHVVMRKLRLDAVADLDDGEIGRALQHGAGDQVADAAGELLVDGLAAGLANDGADDALGVLRGDAADVGGGDVALLELGVLAGLLVGLADRDQLVDIDLARLAVDGHSSIPLEVEDMLIAFGQGGFQAVDQIELVDLALMGQGLQSLDQLRTCHVLASFLQTAPARS